MADWELVNPIALAKQRRSRAPWYLDLSPVALSFSIIGIVMLTSMLYLTQASRVAAIGYDIKALEHTRTKLRREREQLQLQASYLQGLARAEEQAVTRLKMVRTPGDQFAPAPDLAVDIESPIRQAEAAAVEANLSWRERLAAAILAAPSTLARAARGSGGSHSDSLTARADGLAVPGPR